MTQDNKTVWPPLPYADWAETCTALHLLGEARMRSRGYRVKAMSERRRDQSRKPCDRHARSTNAKVHFPPNPVLRCLQAGWPAVTAAPPLCHLPTFARLNANVLYMPNTTFVAALVFYFERRGSIAAGCTSIRSLRRGREKSRKARNFSGTLRWLG